MSLWCFPPALHLCTPSTTYCVVLSHAHATTQNQKLKTPCVRRVPERRFDDSASPIFTFSYYQTLPGPGGIDADALFGASCHKTVCRASSTCLLPRMSLIHAICLLPPSTFANHDTKMDAEWIGVRQSRHGECARCVIWFESYPYMSAYRIAQSVAVSSPNDQGLTASYTDVYQHCPCWWREGARAGPFIQTKCPLLRSEA